MIGKTISHYKIIDELGSGGMGVVYKAEDTKLHRMVALKFLPPPLTRDAGARERFTREAQAASALDHPNVCTIHEIDETDDGRTFIVMACYEGETLRERIGHSPLAIGEALDIACQMAEGLHEAHEKEIVHRDVKPANIMVTGRGQVKIMDFGLAKLREKTILTREGTTLGTVAYMSPEQARGDEVDRRTDIWSLGVVIYEMVTGRRPFKGDYEQAVIYSILNDAPEPMTALRTGVPRELERVTAKALAKDPKDRYQHADELLVDLRKLKAQLDTGGRAEAPAQSKPAIKKWGFALAAAAVIVIALVLARPLIFPDRTGAIGSIAVLPLGNLSGDPSQEYFADGMTEALIADLAKIGTIKVISRTSIMRYKDTDKSLPEIARELDVEAIIEGSVLVTGSRVRITAQLIEAAEDHHLWAENYERDLSDVLALQREVARTIAGEIKVTLTPQEEAGLASPSPIDPDAHEAYLKARYYWNKRTKEDLEKSMEYLERAIEIDPGYALAHVGLAEAYVVLGDWGWFHPKEMYAKAEEIARKVLELDPDLAEAYAAIGAVEHECHYNHDKSEAAFRRAIELKPNYATAHHWYAEMLGRIGRYEEALERYDRALDIDPLSLIITASKASVYYYIRRYDAAIAQARKALELDDTFNLARYIIVMSLRAMGNYEEAVTEYRNLMILFGVSDELIAGYDNAYLEGGAAGVDRWMIDVGWTGSDQPYNIPYFMTTSYARLGEIDSAFVYLDKAYEYGSMYMLLIANDPELDPLRSDPRYTEYLNKVGLAE
jgi:serine/threonine-protein kinase